MNILITGGAGFIGSHLCDELLKEGNNVTAVDNLSCGNENNLYSAKKSDGFDFINTDICNKQSLFNIFSSKKFDVVFHLAANSDIALSSENPDIDFNNTFLTTYNVLNAMKEFNVKNIVFASTSAIYGDLKEEITEKSAPLFPVSHYGASKLASEAFISSFCENCAIKAWIIRFPNVVGERATHGVIFDFINKLKKNPNELEVLGDGNQNKPYIYVKDLIEAILFVWKNTNEKINYFNIGIDSSTTVKEIAEIVIKEMKLNAQIKYTGGKSGWVGDVPQFRYNAEKIHKLGWCAKYTSTEAIQKAVKNILEQDKICRQ